MSYAYICIFRSLLFQAVQCKLHCKYKTCVCIKFCFISGCLRIKIDMIYLQLLVLPKPLTWRKNRKIQEIGKLIIKLIICCQFEMIVRCTFKFIYLKISCWNLLLSWFRIRWRWFLVCGRRIHHCWTASYNFSFNINSLSKITLHIWGQNNYLTSGSRLGYVLLLPADVVFFWASKGL